MNRNTYNLFLRFLGCILFICCLFLPSFAAFNFAEQILLAQTTPSNLQPSPVIDHNLPIFNSTKCSSSPGSNNISFKVSSFSINNSTVSTHTTSDLNNDKNIDLSLISSSSSTINNFLGSGKGTFSSSVPIQLPASGSFILSSDFNNDNMQDLIVLSKDSNSLYFLQNYNNLNYQPTASFDKLVSPVLVSTGDVNNDGLTDTFVLDSEAIYIYHNLGNPNLYKEGVSLDLPFVPTSFVLADINYDKNLDIICGDSSSKLTIFYGDGNSHFNSQETISLTNKVSSILVVDLNNDSRLDLVSSLPNQISVSFGNSFNKFDPPIYLNLPGNSLFFKVGNLNADCFPDIVSANDNKTFSILKNNGNKSFSPSLEFLLPSSPLSLSCSDLNNDLKADLIFSFPNEIKIYLASDGNVNDSLPVNCINGTPICNENTQPTCSSSGKPVCLTISNVLKYGCSLNKKITFTGISCSGNQTTTSGISCLSGQLLCNGICKVGSCCDDSQCTSGKVCTNNSCVCPSGTELIDNNCVSNGCASGSPCTSGQICINGSCSCPFGQFVCNGVCKSECISSCSSNNVFSCPKDTSPYCDEQYVPRCNYNFSYHQSIASCCIPTPGGACQNNVNILCKCNNEKYVKKEALFPTGLRGAKSIWVADQNSVYILGGTNTNQTTFNQSNKIFKYNVGSDSLTELSEKLPVNFLTFSATYDSVNKNIYIFGTVYDNPNQNYVGQNAYTVLKYNILSGVITSSSITGLVNYPAEAYYYSGNNRIYLICPYNHTTSNAIYENKIYEFNPDTGLAVFKLNAPPNINVISAFNYDKGLIYLFGGIWGTSGEIHEYNVANNYLSLKVEKLPVSYQTSSAVWDNEGKRVFIFTPTVAVEYYPDSGVFIKGIALREVDTTNNSNSTAIWAKEHQKAYIFGGGDSYGKFNTIYEYNPCKINSTFLTTFNDSVANNSNLSCVNSQWASFAIASNDFNNLAGKAVGAPNTTNCTSFDNCWTASPGEGSRTIEFTFDSPSNSNKLEIYECGTSTNFVESIKLFNPAGNLIKVLNKDVDFNNTSACVNNRKILSVNIPTLNDNIKKVRIVTKHPGNESIDAVKLVCSSTLSSSSSSSSGSSNSISSSTSSSSSGSNTSVSSSTSSSSSGSSTAAFSSTSSSSSGSSGISVPSTIKGVHTCKRESSSFKTVTSGCKQLSSNLVWDYQAPIKLTFQEAVAYCDSRQVGVYNDWRLPSRTELKNVAINNGAINSFYFNLGDSNNRFWSYSVFSGQFKYVVSLFSGFEGSSLPKDKHPVVCVRRDNN